MPINEDSNEVTAPMTPTTHLRDATNNNAQAIHGNQMDSKEFLDNEKLSQASYHQPHILLANINEIAKQVLRKKLAKQRHLVLKEAINPAYLDCIMPSVVALFRPQTVTYNGGVASIKNWKISCYLEVMKGGVPTADPSLELLDIFRPLLDTCNTLFNEWYRQQHSIKNPIVSHRLMTFITRYTPAPGEQSLLKHVDGAGKVDGSIVVALPMDQWSAPLSINAFEGGGLTFWDGRDSLGRSQEIHYDTRSGDVGFIDRAVWHQADPITKGTRWALVIFYRVV